jgi:hypothetical protein
MNKRTSFITAAAVAGVMLAGTAAVGANIGILNAADTDIVGQLPATITVPADDDTTTTVEPQVIDVYIEDAALTATSTTLLAVEQPIGGALAAGVQRFDVDDAGSVDVERTETGVLLAGVDEAAGWSWSSQQASETELVVTFTSFDTEYVFFAESGPAGTVTARVEEPIVNIVQAPAPAPQATPVVPPPANTASAGGYHDDDESHDEYEDDDSYDEVDEHDEDDEDDDRDEYDEYDEYEGGDDDD